MEVYFELITGPEELSAACAKLAGEKYLGFDTETTELDPFDGRLRLVQFSGSDQTVVIDLKPFEKFGDLRSITELEPLRKLISAEWPIKIAHNAKFDAKWVSWHLNAELGGTFDTFLASQLIAAGERERRHGLADVAAFFLGTEVDKSEQVSNWDADELSASQIEYAARDAALMIPLREKLVERLQSDALMSAAKLEFDCVVPIAQMELNGVFLDEELWRVQLERVTIGQQKAAEELQGLLAAGVAQASLFGAPEINLDSHQQVTDALTNLGIPVPETTRAWELEPLAAKYDVVAKLLAYRAVAKSATSFGENLLEFIKPETGRIHPDFRQIGAPSGRFSCSAPNVQQIPHKKEYRRCFRAPDGKKLIIADYSQIELRILAEFSGDRNFLEAFRGGTDFHAAAAAQVFNVAPEEVTNEQRSFAKRLNFGVVYGIGAQRFATLSGVSNHQAENILRKYFTTHSGLETWLREAGDRAISDGSARTASGRLAKFRFEEGNREQIASTKRYGKNLPIQGTSADILKRSLRLLHDAIAGTSAKLVNIVHDEVIVEVDEKEASDVAILVERSMVNAAGEYLKNVPVVVDIGISDAWDK